MRYARCLTIALLLALAACHGQPPAGQAGEWAATIASRLYERQLLSAAGRDELQRRIAGHALSADYSVPGSEQIYSHRATDPATVLVFCTEAFQAEMSYRIGQPVGASDLYIAGQAPDSAAGRAQQRWAAALRQAGGDTVAAWRRLASPGQLLEQAIKAEDSVAAGGWTIYPPLGRAFAGIPPHSIADTRSIWGKTRTRTARDFYELGLLTRPDYELLKQDLPNQLLREEQVCSQAAQLALNRVVRPARRHALDSVLTKLHQAAILTTRGRQQALADSQLGRSFLLFDVLPHCTHARVLNLHALPRAPRRLYPQLLAGVAAIWPAFRYTDVQVVETEKDMGDGTVLDQQVALSFRAGGRRYLTTFTQGYRRQDGTDPDPATGAEVSEDFVAGINQWLRDQHAPQRLYVAHTPDERSVYGRDRLGFIVLTPSQRAVWGLGSYFLTSEDQANEASQFTSEFIEESLALYQRIGLFAGLTPADLAAGRRQALGGKINSFPEMLRGFPRLLVATGGEDAEAPRAYAHALAAVAASTRGAFQPTQVQDTFTGQEAREQPSRLSFRCGPRRYRARLVSDAGWMDGAFLPLVERAVRESTHGGQLCLLGADESSVYVFLTATQAAALHQLQPAFFDVMAKANAPASRAQTLSQDLPF